MSTPIMSMEIEGIEELEKALTRIDEKMQKTFMRQAMREEAKKIADMIKVNTPVHSGRLKKSIKVRAGGKRSRKVITMRVMTGTRDQLGIPSETTGYYPMSLEYGTKNGRLRENRFMRNALEANKSSFAHNVASNLRRRLGLLAK